MLLRLAGLGVAGAAMAGAFVAGAACGAAGMAMCCLAGSRLRHHRGGHRHDAPQASSSPQPGDAVAPVGPGDAVPPVV